MPFNYDDNEDEKNNMAKKFGVTPEEQAKVQDNLQNYSEKEARVAALNKMLGEKHKALELSMNSERTPEEEQFVSQHMDPLTRGAVTGGIMGSVSKVAPGAFGRISQMMRGGPPTGVVDAVSHAPISSEGFVKTAARLDAGHPAMMKNREIINNLVKQHGEQHPDVAVLQQAYNKMLK
jgi:hypothetical protein